MQEATFKVLNNKKSVSLRNTAAAVLLVQFKAQKPPKTRRSVREEPCYELQQRLTLQENTGNDARHVNWL